jgi:hypothetical protein
MSSAIYSEYLVNNSNRTANVKQWEMLG